MLIQPLRGFSKRRDVVGFALQNANHGYDQENKSCETNQRPA